MGVSRPVLEVQHTSSTFLELIQ